MVWSPGKYWLLSSIYFNKIFQKASYSNNCWRYLCQAAAQVWQKLLDPLIRDRHQLLWGWERLWCSLGQTGMDTSKMDLEIGTSCPSLFPFCLRGLRNTADYFIPSYILFCIQIFLYRFLVDNKCSYWCTKLKKLDFDKYIYTILCKA